MNTAEATNSIHRLITYLQKDYKDAGWIGDPVTNTITLLRRQKHLLRLIAAGVVRGWIDVKTKTEKFSVLCADYFEQTTDYEITETADIQKLAALSRNFGVDGVIAWVAHKQTCLPLPKYRGATFYAALRTLDVSTFTTGTCYDYEEEIHRN